ncbi:MAG: sulfotransferase family 2 domain-containing protein [Candidatus Electrothrix scaldis]|nr:MAG: sulfotransferase family 2 domain-containing protein [Candidatus Electrothrix sp. GW3-3]
MNISALYADVKKEVCCLVSRPKRILFDHLPKCGGSSLTTYLASNYPKRKIFCIEGSNPRESVESFKRLSQNNRYSIDLIQGHLAHELLDWIHPDTLKITVLRGPVDRIISHYYYVKLYKNHYLHEKVSRAAMTLEEYALSGLSNELRNWYTTHFSGYTVEEAEKSPEESIAKAAEIILRQYDVVGFLDDFTGFVATLKKKARLWSIYKDKKINVAKKRPALDEISLSIRNTIEQVNFLDIALYERIKERVEMRQENRW